jgi:zinc transporter ZupT
MKLTDIMVDGPCPKKSVPPSERMFANTADRIFTIRRFADWGHRNTAYFMCFAAGVLIAASFLHMIPKSFSMNPQAPIWLLVDFLGLHLFNRFITAFVCEKDPDRQEYAIGVVPMLGIGRRTGLCRRHAPFAQSRTGE